MDPPGPVPAHGDGMLLGELPEQAVDVFVDVSRTHGPALLSLELRHLGGALRPGAMAGGAVDGIDAAFAVFAAGMTPTEEATRAVTAAVDVVQCSLAPWSTGGCYLNFAERPKSGQALFGVDVHRRLTRIKAAYDPADVIRANHPVPPAS
ncbi:Berberine/berberine domain protein [Parafrankia sp. EAN1pec]|uniref:BBE domain-containing protein n=1 Tax=Parafrankia sp. (strain EAN1pec) TaxID=298653 RepID=UPI0000541392|nr:Berberine/berberine domain protein [Frankia sp. EAN1pec]